MPRDAIVEALPDDGGERVIRVVLVDDQALMRAGFRALLEAEDGIEVVGEAADGEQGVALVRASCPTSR